MTKKREEMKAREVVKFFRSQEQQIRNVRLLGLKVLLQPIVDVDEVSAYITKNYTQYSAHGRAESKPIMSIWYEYLMPVFDSKWRNEDLAEEVVELFQKQKQECGDLQLLSIKVMLPKGADAGKISEYIVEKDPKYKAHSKEQGEYPIVAIGYK